MAESVVDRWNFMSRKVIGAQDNPMLIRWRLIQTPIGGIYLHFIAREDLDRMPHDHPWGFWSLVLRGGYAEDYHADSRLVRRAPSGNSHSDVAGRLVEHGRWSLHRFPLGAAHRIVLVAPHTTTLVFVGRKRRTWGFYDGSGRFTDWRDYHEPIGGWSEQQKRHLGLVPRPGQVGQLHVGINGARFDDGGNSWDA